MESSKISHRQFTILIILFLCGDTILYAPSALADVVKQDAWLVALMALVPIVLYSLLQVGLVKLDPSSNFFDLLTKIAGKWGGKFLFFLFILTAFYTGTSSIWEIGDFLNTQILIHTPRSFVILLFSIIVICITRLGIETIGRTAELLFPPFLALFILMLLFLTPKIEWKHIQPVFETDPATLAYGSVYFLSYNLGSIIIIVLFHLVSKPSQIWKPYLVGNIVANIILIAMILFSLLVLGPNLTSLKSFPSYVLAQKINVGDFFQRIEVIMTFIWFITVYIKVSLCYYVTVLGSARLLRLNDQRRLAWPLGMIFFVTGVVAYKDRVNFYQTDHPWVLYMLTMGLILPCLLWIAGLMKKKLKKW